MSHNVNHELKGLYAPANGLPLVSCIEFTVIAEV